MTIRRRIALVLLAVGGWGHLALASTEPLEAHAQYPLKTIVLDPTRIAPAELSLAVGDVLVFENHDVHALRVTFVAPDDAAAHVRCGLVRATPSEPEQAPWLLFAHDGGKLAATIPPGRVASLCSLQKGTYVFVVDGVEPEPGAAVSRRTGRIRVE